MSFRPLLPIVGVIVAALALSGCVPNSPADGAPVIRVAIDDDSCKLSDSTAAAGSVTFELTNSGSDVICPKLVTLGSPSAALVVL